jgi:hypothetical protein
MQHFQFAILAALAHCPMTCAAAVFVTLHTGDDESRQPVYSHNGSVEITLSPIPKAH